MKNKPIKYHVMIGFICFFSFLIASINLYTLKKYDEPLFKLINSEHNHPVLDIIFPAVTYFGAFKYVLIACVILGILQSSIKSKQTMFLIIIGIFISAFVSTSFKNHYEEKRPFEVLDYTRLLSYKSSSYAYPSGHTTIAFTAATIIALRHPKLRVISISMAALVGLSRIYIGVHWPTDVLGGALLGITIASIVVLLDTIIKTYNSRSYRVNRSNSDLNEKRISLLPTPSQENVNN